ncbi:transcription factor bHLH95-like [Prosopis cineraria]|uniref:transcription factor bHLH95-like n=1 Tax=Prosopis cineraria TaxID=364024 RepID=UPI00240F8177|nr:transcription factor bHLH95-like [Prosopis cineraria]XP_054790871.1 transcription factor bHLH95-like [Prosopis cineraria]
MSADNSDDSDKQMENLHMNPATRGKEKLVSSSGDEVDTAERERRRKINALFRGLKAMLPHVPSKADRIKVVDETLNYITTLEQTLENLEKKKMERSLRSSVSSNAGHPSGTSRDAFMSEQVASSSSPTPSASPHGYNKPVGFQTWTSPNLVVNICGKEAQFSVTSSKNWCPFSTICCVLEKYKIEVLSAHISCDNGRRFYMFQAQVSGDSDQVPGALSAEETFKQAAEEIILRIT